MGTECGTPGLTIQSSTNLSKDITRLMVQRHFGPVTTWPRPPTGPCWGPLSVGSTPRRPGGTGREKEKRTWMVAVDKLASCDFGLCFFPPPPFCFFKKKKKKKKS